MGILFLIAWYIAETKHYLKMGWCNIYPCLQQQKAVPLFISAYIWCDVVAVETGENKIP